MRYLFASCFTRLSVSRRQIATLLVVLAFAGAILVGRRGPADEPKTNAVMSEALLQRMENLPVSEVDMTKVLELESGSRTAPSEPPSDIASILKARAAAEPSGSPNPEMTVITPPIFAEMIDDKQINAQLIDAGLIDAELIDAELIDAELIDAELIDAELIDAELIDIEIAVAEMIEPDSSVSDSLPLVVPVVIRPPGEFAGPWWDDLVSSSLRPSATTLVIELDTLFAWTAVHSGRVQAVKQKPWISYQQGQQARAAFDPKLYNDTRLDSTSDPVENTLTTGGPLRLEDNVLGVDTGLRGQNQQGGTYNVGQTFGHKTSNSNFFIPNHQGSARLFANLTHPVMRGRQTDVNRSLILTAQFDTAAAQAEYQTTLQKQLFQVADTYWTLYIARGSLLQRQRHLARASEIANLLASRESHDSAHSQVLRAKAAVTNRVAELAQAEAKIRNLEARLRSLVNAPELTNDRNAEFVPIQTASLQPFGFDIDDEVARALQNRPELSELASKIGSTNVGLRLARDQMKPTLNLVAEGYLAGRQGNSDILGAFSNQFTEGRPGFAAGLVFERPIGNRAAAAAIRQRKLEIGQLNYLIDEATENIRAEVETAVRNLRAAKQSAVSRQISLQAVVKEVAALTDRWELLGNDPRLGQLQLNDLLDAQDRLLQEEQNLLDSLVQYNRALLEVQRATGGLVQFASP